MEETITNPGQALDELGVTCEMLFDRFRRVGAFPAQDAMWNSLQEFSTQIERIDSLQAENFGEEM